MSYPTPIPDLANARPLTDLLRGFTLPMRALRVIVTNSRLLLLSIGSGLVTVAVLVIMAIAFWPLSTTLTDRLVVGDSLWLKGARVGLAIVVYLTLLIVGALTAPNLVLAPLGDPISEATEGACGDFVSPPFTLRGLVRGTWISLTHTLVRVLLMAVGGAVLWPLHFVPIVGSVTWFAVSSLWSMFWLSVEHLSTPMARHFYPFSRVVAVLRARSALTIGFGAALALLLFVPIINFFLLPIAIVAGTLLFRGLLRCRALPPPTV